MNKIEVRSNTEFSQFHWACLQKRGFRRTSNGYKENTQGKEKKTYVFM